MPPIPKSDIDELTYKLNQAEEALNYDIPSMPEDPMGLPIPSSAPDPQQFEPYALIAEQAYNPPEQRKSSGIYAYNTELSNDDYAVYQGSNEYVVGVRGSSPNTPIRDFLRDSQVALGSVSTLTGINLLGEAVSEVDELVKKLRAKDSQKKITLTGHSLGGSIASYYGVDNPNVDIRTFNKGEGLPFLTDAIKCTISGCRNIKNYRIAGDFASLGSKLSNVGTYRTLRPIQPTEEVQEEAKLASGFFIEPELYLPHSISNFIGRKNKREMNSNVYARPLAAKIGKVAGMALPIVGGAVYNQYAKSIGSGFLNEEVLADQISVQDYIPVDIRQTPQEVVSEMVAQEVQEATSSFTNTLTKIATGGLLGKSAGEFAGLAFYEAFLSE